MQRSQIATLAIDALLNRQCDEILPLYLLRSRLPGVRSIYGVSLTFRRQDHNRTALKHVIWHHFCLFEPLRVSEITYVSTTVPGGGCRKFAFKNSVIWWPIIGGTITLVVDFVGTVKAV